MESTPVLSRRPPRIDVQNPWPGLAAYDEASMAFFYGREAEVTALMQYIRHSPITVLYGKSGLGKSSLLQAGLIPKLREAHFLPVYLHVDFSEKADYPPFEQVLQRLEAEMIRGEAEFPSPAPEEGLWQYLHRKDLEIWSPDNFPLTPVLIFDQLEELFYRSRGSRGHVQKVLDDLADLIENRIPPELAAADHVQHEQTDMFSQRYHILLSFREDFLPEIDTWKDRVPSLLHNRLRLLPMSREQAIAATRQAGSAVLEDGVAVRIVDFVANANDEACDGKKAVELEPVLLSLCCYQLNLNRIQAGAEKIDATLVAHSGQNILEAFYQEAIRGMPENVPLFIENNLIQGNDRGCYALKGALDENLIQEDDLHTLISRFRLLRVNQQADTARIELIHDRLVGVVRKSRDERLAAAREHKELQLRKEAEQEAQKERKRRELAEQEREREIRMRKRFVWLTSLFVTVLIVAFGMGIFLYTLTENAKTQQLEAERQAEFLDISRRQAIGLRLIAEAQSMLSGARIEDDSRAFLQILAAHQIMPDVKKYCKESLIDALLKRRGLVKLMVADSPVMAVAFSPDGHLVVSRYYDGSLHRWDTATGQLLGNPPAGYEAAVPCEAVSPDGSRIVYRSPDKTIRLWDATTGQSVGRAFRGHEGDVNSVAFSLDSRLIVTGSGDNTLRLWDAFTGLSLGPALQSHKSGVTCVAISPDGKRIASGSWDKTLRLWELTYAVPMRGHDDWVNSVAFNPDGSCIVSGSGDSTLRLWDTATGQPVGEPMRGHTDRVECVAFSPDGKRIASGSKDNTILLWDAGTRKPLFKQLTGHKGQVNSVAFSPDGSRIVSGGADSTLRLWNTTNGESIGEPLKGHEYEVKSVAFNHTGSRIVSGSGDTTVRLWDADTGDPIGKPLEGHEGWVMSVAFNHDDSRIVSGSRDTTLRLWDAVTGDPIGKPLEGHEDMVWSVAFGPDGSYIVSGSGDTTLRLWDADSGLPVCQPLKGHESAVSCVAFSPDGSRIVSGGGDTTLRLWPVFTDLPEALCKKLTRNMSRREWREGVDPDIDYKCQCPGLPIPSDDPSVPASATCQ